jgi:hypothetical protein
MEVNVLRLIHNNIVLRLVHHNRAFHNIH